MGEPQEFEILVSRMRWSVSGTIIGPLGVHATSTGWRVSHIASGLKITGNYDLAGEADAHALATALKDEDWSGSVAKLMRRRSLRDKVAAALAAIPADRKVPAGAP